jgi:hypothetical protein
MTPLERCSINVRIILKRYKKTGGHGLDSSGTGQVPVAGCCVYGNEHAVSVKATGFLDYLSDYQFITKDCISRSSLVRVAFRLKRSPGVSRASHIDFTVKSRHAVIALYRTVGLCTLTKWHVSYH